MSSLMKLFFVIFLFSFGQKISYSVDVITVAPDIYQIAETNGVAAGLCRAIKFMNMIIIPISAVMFSVIGLAAFNGKLSYTVFVTFAIGIGAFRSAGTVLEYFVPGMGLKYGCSCAKKVRVRGDSGKWETVILTGLDDKSPGCENTR